MSLNILLVDDECVMRSILKKSIEKLDGFNVVGEVDSGEEAIKIFAKLKPEIVILDIEMNGINGIECAKVLVDIDPRVKIIFATAHCEYMMDAFELYAFDYLIKPFKIDRVFKTLEKIKYLTEIEIPKIPNIEEDLMFDRLIIKNKEGISFINTADIVLIQREQGMTVLYLKDGESIITSEGLGDLEDRLDKRVFFRSHKSYIINLSMINKIYPYGRWTYVVKFKNINQDALLTHEKYEEIKKIFK